MHQLAPYPRLRINTQSSHYVQVLLEMLSGDWRRGGDSVADLEKRVAACLNTSFALAMPMARVGIYLAIQALIKPGQKVILSPYTIADVVNMVICAGGVPTFADIDAETCNIRAEEVEKLIDVRTGAVLVTHLYGCVCDIQTISNICRASNVPLIEDAAQAFGASIEGRAAGTIGDVGVLSFGLYKNVTSFLGGMLLTNRESVFTKVLSMSGHAQLVKRRMLLKKVLAGAVTDVITWPPIFYSIFSR